MPHSNSGRVMILLLALALSACGNSNNNTSTAGGGGGMGGGGGGGMNPSCASPMPAAAMDYTLTVGIPSDFDPTAQPTPTPTTDIDFSVLLPERCPGDAFPLILQSHGYSGTRESSVASDGTLDPTEPHFPSLNSLVRALPHYGYVVISYDERGHGATFPDMAQHNARIIDPGAETQDAIALLNWAFDNPDLSFVQQETGTGLAKDVRVGTIGYSYGGGFEMPLAILDERVDTIVPNGTWNNLLYSLVPGDGVKLGYAGALGVLGIQGNVNNTPLVASLFNLVGAQGAAASGLRSRQELVSAATAPVAVPRPAADADELLNFFYTHGTSYFVSNTRDGEAVQPRDQPQVSLPGSIRPVPALFIQGNRDVLFNLTDAYFNFRDFSAAGGDVRLLSTEGGHMLPTAFQVEASANCGGIVGLETILAWFDQKLKGTDSATYQAIPQVCISVTETPAANTAPDNASLIGLQLDDMPIGSQSGTGGIPAQAASLSVTVTAGVANTPTFVPVATIPNNRNNAMLAGIPTASRVSVSGGLGNLLTPTSYVGVGVRRGGNVILVDDQLTPFAALTPDAGSSDCPDAPLSDHCHNRHTNNATVMLAGVGEPLQGGDEVGLVFYENQVQYLGFNSGGQAGPPNPYSATLSNVEIPILIPCPDAGGCFPGSSLSTP